jgi:hypothetical protein
MMHQAKILMIEGEGDVLANNKEFLEGEGFTTISAATLWEAHIKIFIK